MLLDGRVLGAATRAAALVWKGAALMPVMKSNHFDGNPALFPHEILAYVSAAGATAAGNTVRRTRCGPGTHYTICLKLMFRD